MLVYGYKGGGVAHVTFWVLMGFTCTAPGASFCANFVCIDACQSKLDCNCEIVNQTKGADLITT